MPSADVRKIPGFWGRTSDLKWLRKLWDEATERNAQGRFVGGPRMAVIVAETGIGKSRLVQAFYQQLTRDPTWDPESSSYWPDAFQQGHQLQVNPEFGAYEPKGPPKFLWLGARWYPPDDRNSDSHSVTADLRTEVDLHVTMARQYASAWHRLKAGAAKVVEQEGMAGAIEIAADLQPFVPFIGLGLKAYKAGATMVHSFDKASSRAAEARERDDKAIDDLLAMMREVFGGRAGTRLALPTIIWLDDAQWIDPATLDFVNKLWDMAAQEKDRWPLLFVVTHWEREWNELLARDEAARAKSLARFRDVGGAQVHVLAPAGEGDLGAYLTEVLPGLSTSQSALMLEKADGNFLTLVENVGALIPADFVERDRSRALTAGGERRMERWESKRDKRIEQRFGELEESVQDLLGWSSRAGLRFVREVITRFSERKEQERTVKPELLERCVQPYAILGEPARQLLEFRDRSFYAIARRYFDDHLASDEEAIRDAIRGTIATWVDRSFDANGDVLPQSGAGAAPPDSLAGADEAVGKEMFRSIDFEQLDTELRSCARGDWLTLTDLFENRDLRAAIRAALLSRVLSVRDNRVLAIPPSGFYSGVMGPYFPWESLPSTLASAETLLVAGTGPFVPYVRMRAAALRMRQSELGESHAETHAARVLLAGSLLGIRMAVDWPGAMELLEAKLGKSLLTPLAPLGDAMLASDFELEGLGRHVNRLLAMTLRLVASINNDSPRCVPVYTCAVRCAKAAEDNVLVADIFYELATFARCRGRMPKRHVASRNAWN